MPLQPLRLRKEHTGEVTTTVGRVIDKTSLLSVKDTVLDPEVVEKGYWIDLPIEVYNPISQKNISKIYLPRFKSEEIGRIIILNELSGFANFIVRMIEEAYKAGELQVGPFTKMVVNYIMAAAKMAAGKGGVIGGHILSTRVSNSGRAVLIVNGDHSPDTVGLPQSLIHRLKIEHNELVLIGRDPTIWDGSVEILKARPSGNSCIELHPVIFKQLGGDCDGDCVYVYKLPSNPACKEEAENEVLGFVRRNETEWPVYMKKTVGKELIDWSNVIAETQARSVTDGFSISPDDILEKSERVVQFCQRMGKDVVEENYRISTGLSKDEVVQYLLDQNATQLNMKLLLGPIGAVSNRLKILVSDDKKLLKEACVVSEWLQQKLLSSKHTAGNGKRDPYSIWDVLDLLNRRGKYTNSTIADILEEVGKMGMPLDSVRHIFTYLWITYPLLRTVDHFTRDIPHGMKRLLIGVTRRCTYDLSQVKVLIKRLIATVQHCSGKLITAEDIQGVYWEWAIGISKMCQYDFPVYEMTTMNLSESIIRRVLIEGENDHTGVTRTCFETTLSGESQT